jgi:FdhE protein
MNEVLAIEINRLEKAFASIKRDAPFLESAAKAFQEVMVNRMILKAKLSPDPPDIQIPQPDYSRLSEGYPWLTEETITSLIDPWGETVDSAILFLKRAFPKAAEKVVRLREAFEAGELDLKRCIGAFVRGSEDEIIRIASNLGFHPVVLKIILSQTLKPFVEKRTEKLRPFMENFPWPHGYCPICGSFPESSFLQGEEGQRWLKCSLCGYEWRFDRMACPYCGKVDREKEFICVDGFEHEWVELCLDCHRYIVGIDLRKQIEVTSEVAAIGMIHLDMIAQQRGFLPTAPCAWNMVGPDN